ncbi:unnamed protein product [Parnassius apollo]|uniref:(apollo) hypothetical protein n=1 Tax=Parnassius apollo TaxID=110799 RepID=A0A8S3W5P2_PARAO|nr:unnamed protein product [Parnassius apollo]
MKTIEQSMEEMTVLFQSSLAVFKQELNKRQVQLVSKDCDRLEMHNRRRILLIHGVPEDKNEDVAETVIKSLQQISVHSPGKYKPMPQIGINNVTKEEIKSGILLTHLTDETYRLVRNLAYPNTVESLTYNELVQILNSHFKPKQCSFVDKANFFGATRSPGESLGDWAARLRGLASYCEFGDALETNLRDRFVLGLGSGPERDKLFEQNPTTLTLTKAIEIGEQAACAREVKVMLNTSDFWAHQGRACVSCKNSPVRSGKRR